MVEAVPVEAITSMTVDMLSVASMSVNMLFVEPDGPCCPPLLAAPLDEEGAQELAAVLKALADPVRLRLVSLIASSPGGEICACDLPSLLGRSQPTVSHHLTHLVRAGILGREQRGKWAWFSLRPGRLAALADALSVASDGPVTAPLSR
jgi:ArsR family transcriptional regulator, arsenate/arsenite/antimonite-responsive transcriptional repressor